MPATITTRETFPKDSPRERLEAEVNLRIKAGAISSKLIEEDESFVIETEWNVIGEQ